MSPPKGTIVAELHKSTQTEPSPTKATIDEMMSVVRNSVNKGDFEAALNLLQPYIHHPQRFPTLYSDYLVILIWSGHRSEAIHHFESLQANFPKRTYLLRNMAKAYFDSQVYEKAHELYAQVLEQTPGDETALQGLVETLIAVDQAEQAETLLNEFGNPIESLARGLLKARLLVEQSKYGQALAWYDQLIKSRPQNAEQIERHRDNVIAGLSPKQQAEMLRQFKEQTKSGHVNVLENYALCLALTHRYLEAVELLTRFQIEPENVFVGKAYWYAWAFFKSDRPAEAQAGFAAILGRNPQHLPSLIGNIYCLASQYDFKTALAELEKLSRTYPENLELLFAEAFVYEKQSRFWDAIRVYERIQNLFPGNSTAGRMRLRAYSDLGASSLAAGLAAEERPGDYVLQQSILNDLGIDRLNWEESEQALKILFELRETSRDLRHTFDYIAALDKADRYSEIVTEYKALERSGKTIPAWVIEIVANAYAELKHPQCALTLYNQALEADPYSKNARIGKFYVLMDLRHWDAAEAQLTSLEADTPDKIKQNDRVIANPEKFELVLERGWFLTEQERLREADDYFNHYYHLAPANVEIRSALAHIHLWRGWSRRALEEFKIIDSLQPGYLPSQPGKLTAMNTLNFKRAAREQIKELLEKHPENDHLLDVQQSFRAEQMNILRTEVTGQREDNETYDLSLKQTFSTPLSLKSRLYNFMLWQGAWNNNEENGTAEHLRAGIGLEHRFNMDWQIDTNLSMDIKGKDAGLAARITYTPSDHWMFAAFGDSFITNIPRLARVKDIQANSIGLEGTWRQSEWRQSSLGYTRSPFSDGNDRDEFFLGYEQNLWVKNDWRMRLFLDLYTSRNSKGDKTVYFNPEQDWSFSVTHMTEQTLKRKGRKSFIHRLFVSLGSYQQKGYGGGILGSLRYEQEHEFSARHYLLIGLGIGRKIYDGEGVDNIHADLIYQWRF